MAEETKHLGKQAVKTCAVCGGDNPSFADLLATCTQCGICEHGYCMRELTRNIPDDWICESCDETESSGEEGSEEDTLLSPSSSSDGHHEITQLPISSIVCGKTSPTRSKKERPVGTGKVKFIPAEEVIRLTSGASENKSCILISKPGHANSDTVASLKSPKISSVAPNFSSICIPSRPRTPRPGITPISSIFNEQASQQTIKELKEKRAAAVPTKEHAAEKYMKERERSKEREAREKAEILKKKKENDERKEMKDKEPNEARCTLSPAEHSPLDIAGKSKKGAVPTREHTAEKHIEREKLEREAREKAEILKKEENNEWKEMKEKELKEALRTLSQAEHSPLDIAGKNNQDGGQQATLNMLRLYHIYLPALKTTWKGEFIITNRNAPGLGGLVAQPPCKVHRKVLEFSQKMPSVLQFNMLPRLHIWADLFHNGSPDLRDVALYFFNADDTQRSKQGYFELFECLETQNSMLRSYIDGVELLIFTSKQLNSDSQYIMVSKLEFFFWGVFRRAKNKTNEEPSLSVTCADEKMEVDMIGGKDVRRVDVAVKRENHGVRRNNIPSCPPGFPEKKTTSCLAAEAPEIRHNKTLKGDSPNASLGRGDIHGVRRINATSRLTCFPEKITSSCLAAKAKQVDYGSSPPRQNKTMKGDPPSLCRDSSQSAINSPNAGLRRDDNHEVRRTNVPSFLPGSPEIKAASFSAKEQNVHSGGSLQRENKRLKGNPPGFCGDSSSPNSRPGRNDIPTRSPGFCGDSSSPNAGNERNDIPTRSPGFCGDSSSTNAGHGRNDIPTRSPCFHRDNSSPNAGHGRNDIPSRSPDFRDDRSSPSTGRGRNDISTCSPGFRGDNSRSVITSPDASHGRNGIPTRSPGFRKDSSSPNAGNGRNDIPSRSPGFRRDSSSTNVGHGRNDIPTCSPGFHRDSSSPNTGHGRNDIPSRSPGFHWDRSSPNTGRGRNDIPTCSPGFRGGNSRSVITYPNASHGRNDTPTRSPGFRGDNS